MGTITVTNVTDAARDPLAGLAKWGDTLRVAPSGLPGGKNYHTIKAFDANQNDPVLSYVQRKTANGDGAVEFTLGADGTGISPWNPLTPPGSPQETQVHVYIWTDADADIGNGVAASAAFFVQAP